MSRARMAAVLVFAVSLVVAALMVTDALPSLRGPAPFTDVWHWPYQLRPAVRWLPAIVIALLLGGVSVWWISDARQRLWPLWLVAVLSLGLQLGIVYADRPNIGAELVDRTLSKDTNGYAAVAGEIEDFGAALRDFPALMTSFDNEHARTHPPGLIAAYWLADRAFRSVPTLAEWVGAPVRFWRCTDLWVLSRPLATSAGLLVGAWIPALAAGLTPVVGYYVARRLFVEPAARLSAVLAAAIPALIVFSPTPDQLFALLSLVSLWFLLRGLSRGGLTWLGLAGVVVSVMIMLSIGNGAWAALLGVYAAITIWRSGWTFRRWLIGLGALAMGMASAWLVFWLGWGVAPWEIIATGLDQHYQLVTSQRDYVTWLAYNPLDFGLFAGLAVIVGLGGLALAALVRPRLRDTKGGLLSLLLVGLLLLLNLSGGTRGEVGRLWLVFMPLAAVLAAGGWSRLLLKPSSSITRQKSWMRTELALVVAAQLLLVLSIGLAWRPMQAVILPVVRPVMPEIAEELTPLDVVFTTPEGRRLPLHGYSSGSRPSAGGAVVAHLLWRAEGPTLEPYTVFAHVVDEQGNLVAQQDNWPVGGTWPTTCWRRGETILDPYWIDLPAETRPGPYRLLVGVYGGPYGGTAAERLLTTTGEDALELYRFEVEP